MIAKRRAHAEGPAKAVVTYGLTAALFVFGWIVLGTMLLLNEIFGGAEIRLPENEDKKPRQKAA
jgi:hypothetical protein